MTCNLFYGRWAVENQIGKKNLIIEDCDSKQSVYVYGCKDSVLQVKGDANVFDFSMTFIFLNTLFVQSV